MTFRGIVVLVTVVTIGFVGWHAVGDLFDDESALSFVYNLAGGVIFPATFVYTFRTVREYRRNRKP